MAFKHCIVLSLIVFIAGCTQKYQWKAITIEENFTDDLFFASIIPVCNSRGCKSFTLNIENKTNSHIELNWNKTYFIDKNKTSGRFMFEEVSHLDRHQNRVSDIVFIKSKLSKVIWPNNLVRWSSGQYVGGRHDGWRHESMSEGIKGVYLTINVDGKEIHKKLLVYLQKAN